MPQDKLLIHCPVRGPLPFEPCPREEVEPVIEHLNSNNPVDEAVVFPRGTHLPDGRLDLCKQNLGPNGCRRVANALNCNEFVRSLLLGTNGIGDEGAGQVGELIESNSKLEVLYLGCNGITGKGAQLLANSLLKRQQLTGLWLKRNPIGDDGVEAISRVVANHESLKVLDLVNCGFGKRGLECLCEALKNDDCQLERLYLGGNGLDDIDAAALAEVLSINQRLKFVYLNVGAMGDRGVSVIAEQLESNYTIRELGLASNGIKIAGLDKLLSSVVHHRALFGLDLGYAAATKILGASPNWFGDAGAKLVADFLRQNKTIRSLNLARTGMTKVGRNIIESAIATNRTIQRCVIDGGMSPSISEHLRENQLQSASSVPEEVALIRSVYRTR